MNYHNEFDDPPRGSFLANIGPKAAFFIVLIALSFMIGVVWKLYSGSADNVPSDIPIVRADSEPFKVVPDEPGGMEIRHKDSTLFSDIEKERAESDARIENLLADDENEEPMPRSQLFAGLNTQPDSSIGRNDAPTPLDQPVNAPAPVIPTPEKVKPVVEEVAPEPEPVAEPAPEPVKVEEKPEPKVEVKAEPKPTPKPKPVAEPAPVETTLKAPVEIRTDSIPVTPNPTSATGEYYIQLASTRDKASAGAEWKKLSKKYSAISGLSYRVETADLGSKGVYYRIQAGPLSKSEAQSKCAAIKKINPSGCLVKR